MADDIEQGNLSDAEFKQAVEELTADEPKPKPKKGSPEAELEALEERRREMKAKGAKVEDGEWAKVKTRIAELKAELGIR